MNTAVSQSAAPCKKLVKVHAAAAFIGFLVIATFWSSTVISELFMDHAAVATVKHSIALALFFFVPIMALAGLTGKKLRLTNSLMPKIAANGTLILMPCAIILNLLAQRNDFSALFYSLQALELVAGAANLIMITLHLRRLKSGHTAPTA